MYVKVSVYVPCNKCEYELLVLNDCHFVLNHVTVSLTDLSVSVSSL